MIRNEYWLSVHSSGIVVGKGMFEEALRLHAQLGERIDVDHVQVTITGPDDCPNREHRVTPSGYVDENGIHTLR